MGEAANTQIENVVLLAAELSDHMTPADAADFYARLAGYFLDASMDETRDEQET